MALLPSCGEAFSEGGSDPGDGGGSDRGVPSADGAPSGPFCQVERSKHFFCDDFDEKSGDVARTWDPTSKTSSGFATLALDGAITRSGPFALLAGNAKDFVRDPNAAFLEKGIGRVQQVTLAFDVFVEQYGSNEALASPSPEEQFNLVARFELGLVGELSLALVSPARAAFAETFLADAGLQQTLHSLSRSVPTGAWTRVVIDVGLSKSVPTAKVQLDGQVVLDTELTYKIPSADTRVRIGMFATNAPRLWKVRFDNVTIDKP